MSKLLQLRGGTTSEHSSFTGALREVTVDTDKDTLVIHDGSTAGGHALPRTAAEIVALISNDAIDSQHYAAGSIDTEHLSADSVTVDKLNLISTSSTPSLEARSDGTTDGYIQLNCTVNSHGIKLMSPPHSAGASYTLVFPPNDGDNGQFLTSNGSGVMTWTTADLTNLSGASLTSGIIPTARINAGSIANDLLDSQHYAAGSIDLEHLSSESVDEDNLYVSNAGSNGQYLQKQSGNAGGLTWGTVDLTTLSGANLTSGIIPTARINASSIANDLLDSQHYAAGSIDTEHLAADSVTTAKIADSVALGGSPTTTTQSAADNSTKVATTAYADAAIAALADSAPSTLNTLNELAAALNDDASFSTTVTDSIALKAPIASPTFTGNIGMPNGSIDRAMIGVDQVDGSKIEDDSINSEHIANGAIDLAHMSANSVDSDQYVDGSIDRVHLAADIIDGTKIANDVINSEHYAAGSIDREHLAADIIDGSKIDNDSINSEHYVDGSIDNQHISGMAASKLTGALPAISGASLTNLPAASLVATPLAVGAYIVAYYTVANSTSRAAGYTFSGSSLRHKWNQPSSPGRIYPSEFGTATQNSNLNAYQSAGAGGTWQVMHAMRADAWSGYWSYPIIVAQRVA